MCHLQFLLCLSLRSIGESLSLALSLADSYHISPMNPYLLYPLLAAGGLAVGLGVGRFQKPESASGAKAGSTSSARNFSSDRPDFRRETRSQNPLHQALRQWAKVDPSGEMLSLEALKEMGESLIGYGPEAVMEAFTEIRLAPKEGFQLLKKIALAVSTARPEAALSWFEALSPGCQSDSEREQLLWSACEIPARQIPRSIWNALGNFPESTSRDRLQGLALASIGRLEGETVMTRLLEQIAETGAGEGFVASFSKELARDHVEVAQRVLLNLSEGPLRTRVASEILASLSEKNPRAIVEWLVRLPADLMTPDLLGGFSPSIITRGDPSLIVGLLSIVDGFPGSREWSQEAIQYWLSSDPDKATQWLRDAGGTLSGDRQASMASAVVSEHPEIVETWMARATDPGVQAILARALVKSKFTGSPEEAEAFISRLPACEAQAAARKQLGYLLVNADQEKAAAYFAAHPEALTRTAAASLYEQQATKNPEGALAAIEKMSSAWQPELIGRAVQSWASSDPTAARRWLDSLPAGPGHDVALTAVANQISMANPQEAMTLIAKISNPRVQLDAVKQPFTTWSQNDPAAAAAWLSGQGNAYSHIHPELEEILAQARVSKVQQSLEPPEF
jgi:hypothetical protein